MWGSGGCAGSRRRVWRRRPWRATRSTYRRNVHPCFGERELSEITGPDLVGFARGLRAQRLAAVPRCFRSPRPRPTLSGCCWYHRSWRRSSPQSSSGSGPEHRAAAGVRLRRLRADLERAHAVPLPAPVRHRGSTLDAQLHPRMPGRDLAGRRDHRRRPAAAMAAPRLPQDLRDRRHPLRAPAAHRRQVLRSSAA